MNKNMNTFIFDKKDYQSYKDMYKDMAHKMRCDQFEDYFDTTTFSYDPNILWEYLVCEFQYGKPVNIKIILKNFDLEAIKTEKPYDNYMLNLIIKVFEDFVKEYPNNKLEFVNEDTK